MEHALSPFAACGRPVARASTSSPAPVLRNALLPPSRCGIRAAPRTQAWRSHATSAAEVGAGGNDSDGRAPPGGGGGGGGDGSEGSGDDSRSDSGKFFWKGWNDRVSMDPNFAMKVLVEQVIGVGAAVLGDMAGRPNWGLKELDFVFSTLVVGSILNFSLMYLLAATPASAAGASGSFIQKLFSEQTLKSLGAPGGHFFEKGFTIPQRFINLGYKGFIFSLVGFGAGMVGTGLSNGLLFLRKTFDPNFTLQNETPNIFFNSATWACHMGVSSNVRYQTLYGLDMVLAPYLPGNSFLIYSACIRTVNNVLGGVSFVYLAKLFGVQKTVKEDPKEIESVKQESKLQGQEV